MMYANICLCLCIGMCNDTSASCSNYVGKTPTIMWLYDQEKACMKMKDQVMRRWMLHVNVSRKGYGNALIGRYGGYFEVRYYEAYDDRAYHAKDFDALAKFSPTLNMRKGNARYRRG